MLLSKNRVWFHEEIGNGPNPNRRNAGPPTDAEYGSTRFRIAVEATPQEIAEMEKAEKK